MVNIVLGQLYVQKTIAICVFRS